MANNAIKSIRLKKFKGIIDKEIKFSTLTPNKLCVVVGSNGTGKSSFAHSFNYLSKEKFIPENADIHKEDVTSYKMDAFIEIKSVFNDMDLTLTADSKSNLIKNYYTFTVINSRLRPKDQYVSPGIKIPKFAVEDIEICKILDKTSVDYSPSIGKQVCGSSYQKLFNNIDWFYEDIDCVIKLVEKFYDFSELITLQRLTDDFLKSLDPYISKFSKSDILDIISKNNLSTKLLANSKFQEILFLLQFKHNYTNYLDSIFDAIEVIFYKIDKTNLRNFIEYKQSANFIHETETLINVLNSTKREVLIRKNKTLMLKLPDPTTISNGERDLLCLLASVYSILNSVHRKQQSVIVFDEIFDYLDGGNILEFQYLIDYLIQTSKKNNAKTYFIAFTHLDPVYFDTFVLKNKDVEYFDDYSDVIDNDILIKYIENREYSSIENDIAKYFFHYHPSNFVFDDISKIKNDFELNFVRNYPSQDIFYKHLENCVEKYIAGQKYPFVEVCIWIRINCEKYAYHKLDDIYKAGFLDQHMTRKKLEYARKTIVLPEIFNLFKFVYNEAEHLQERNFILSKKNLHLKFTSKSVQNLVNILKEAMECIE